MNPTTDTHLDACAILDRLDKLIASLAERVSQRDQGDHTDTTGQPGRQPQPSQEELTMNDNTSTSSMNDITGEILSLQESGMFDKWADYHPVGGGSFCEVRPCGHFRARQIRPFQT